MPPQAVKAASATGAPCALPGRVLVNSTGRHGLWTDKCNEAGVIGGVALGPGSTTAAAPQLCSQCAQERLEPRSCRRARTDQCDHAARPTVHRVEEADAQVLELRQAHKGKAC